MDFSIYVYPEDIETTGLGTLPPLTPSHSNVTVPVKWLRMVNGLKPIWVRRTQAHGVLAWDLN